MEKRLFIEKSMCCGCGSCANICKMGAIQMKEDKDGFLYPYIDADKCVNCGMCEKHCPIVSHDTVRIEQHHVENYGGYLKNRDELLQSASGGAATAISNVVLKQGGVVFGVSYTDNYRKAKNIKISSLDELSRIKDSKYVQSDKENIYVDVKKELDNGRMVLYTGTPCEIGAVKAFLGKEYENLYSCELICHGPTTYKVAEKYLDAWEKNRKSKIHKMSVKSKDVGWKEPFIKLEFENGDAVVEKLYQSDFGIGFTVMVRESCHQCIYKGDGKVADITVGDFWGADERDEYWNPDGISAISIHTEKGKKLLQMLSELKLFPVGYETILRGNPNLERSEPYNRASVWFKRGVRSIGLRNTVFVYGVYQQTVKSIKKFIGRT